MNTIVIDIYVDKLSLNIFNTKNREDKQMLSNEIVLPKSFDILDRLKYIRKIIDIIIKDNSVKKAHINTYDSLDLDIINIIKIEGIIEELLSSYGVEICK